MRMFFLENEAERRINEETPSSRLNDTVFCVGATDVLGRSRLKSMEEGWDRVQETATSVTHHGKTKRQRRAKNNDEMLRKGSTLYGMCSILFHDPTTRNVARGILDREFAAETPRKVQATVVNRTHHV